MMFMAAITKIGAKGCGHCRAQRINGSRLVYKYLQGIGKAFAVEKALRIAKRQIGANTVDIIAPDPENIGYRIGVDARRNAKRRGNAVQRGEGDPVADTQAKLARDPLANGDAALKIIKAADFLFGVGDERDLPQIRLGNADHLHADIAVIAAGHKLAGHNGRDIGNTGNRAQLFGLGLVIGDKGRGIGIGVIKRRHNGGMRVGAQHTGGEFLTKPDHDGLHNDQRGHAKQNADQRIPGNDGNAAFLAPGAQIAPGDHPFECGKGFGGHRSSVLLGANWAVGVEWSSGLARL